MAVAAPLPHILACAQDAHCFTYSYPYAQSPIMLAISPLYFFFSLARRSYAFAYPTLRHRQVAPPLSHRQVTPPLSHRQVAPPMCNSQVAPPLHSVDHGAVVSLTALSHYEEAAPPTYHRKKAPTIHSRLVAHPLHHVQVTPVTCHGWKVPSTHYRQAAPPQSHKQAVPPMRNSQEAPPSCSYAVVSLTALLIYEKAVPLLNLPTHQRLVVLPLWHFLVVPTSCNKQKGWIVPLLC